MTIVAQLVAGFVVGYVYASLLESFFHEKVNDAPRARVAKWKRFPTILAPMIRTHFSHHTIHHCRTYRKDHITQFQSEDEKRKLDAELSAFQHGREVSGAQYGNKFSFWGWVAFCSPLVPGLAVSLVLFSIPVAVGVFLAVMLPPVMSNYVHPYLHMPTAKVRESAPWPIRLFARTRYFRFIARYHFLHHRHAHRNFNLVFGGDFIRGKLRRANARDIAEMRRIGLELD